MKRIGVMTSGGDAPGMNAAVRSIVRHTLDNGWQPYAILDGYTGMYTGGDSIRPFNWADVGGIMHKGGTVIGTARCKEFREVEGRKEAARNLLEHGIDALVIVGGNGSLTGARIFQKEWPSLLKELVAEGKIMPETAESHPVLHVAGIVGSIDNDMCGTDISLGADTALHRIVDAVDAIADTAASHQRTFVVEVMGRRCGYLALMSGLATAADWVLIPESPPNIDVWEEKMCQILKRGREIGKRDSIVIVSEGAQDRHGNPIAADYVRQQLEERLNENARVTILGHVQRGGSPTAFDRNLGTLLGANAVDAIVGVNGEPLSVLVGLVGNKIVRNDLQDCLDKTFAIRDAINAGEYGRALEMRGKGFVEAFATLKTLVRAQPRDVLVAQRRLRIGILNAGAPAPGMNTAVRAAVRLAIDRGHTIVGFQNGFKGLIKNQALPLEWMTVNGLTGLGGAFLGTSRHALQGRDFYAIARCIEEQKIDALLVIGGLSGYKAAVTLVKQRQNFHAFEIPIVCLPATIDNDLPGAELSVGVDTALNSVIEAMDKIKQSAVATNRVFVAEVMGHKCGYLALMSALATGAERVYLPEEGVTLSNLKDDVEMLIAGFREGKKLGVVMFSEKANMTYSVKFISDLFEEEGGDLFDVRQVILGHIQQGGNPSPFDRIYASRFASKSVVYIEEQIESDEPVSACLGMVNGKYRFTPLEDMDRLLDKKNDRPKEQWWLDLRPVARVLAKPNSGYIKEV